MAERGVKVDHATLNRWVVKFSPLIASEAQRRKSATDNSWRMDETYIKVKGKWCYYYRAVDKNGETLGNPPIFSIHSFGLNPPSSDGNASAQMKEE